MCRRTQSYTLPRRTVQPSPCSSIRPAAWRIARPETYIAPVPVPVSACARPAACSIASHTSEHGAGASPRLVAECVTRALNVAALEFRLGLHRLGLHRLGLHRLGLHRLGLHRLGLRRLGLHRQGLRWETCDADVRKKGDADILEQSDKNMTHEMLLCSRACVERETRSRHKLIHMIAPVVTADSTYDCYIVMALATYALTA